MASSIWNQLQAKRSLFLIFLSFLLLLLVLHHTTPTTTTRLFSSYSPSPPSHSHSQSTPPRPLAPDPAAPSPIGTVDFDAKWEICRGRNGVLSVDYIPCLDNVPAIKALKSRRHMEHRERHCPVPSPRCLVASPKGYKTPVPWPESRDKIWFNNVPHPRLVEYKKDQNWVQISGEYLLFPGGGTQFKGGVANYINFIEMTLPAIQWGRHTRVILDVGCGVASFGGKLLDKGVITMSVAPKDEHEAQIQFALERGIPAVLSVIGTQRLPFSDNSYDAIHCARCRVHWDADGGKPLMELNRILRPGGFFIWSATPVYRDDERDRGVWNAMVKLTESICWKTVKKATDKTGIGLVIYQKPFSNSCYLKRPQNVPPLCDGMNPPKTSWYVPLDGCVPKLSTLNSGVKVKWPSSWPERLSSGLLSLSGGHGGQISEGALQDDTEHWKTLVSSTYLSSLGITWSSIRNAMDMNAVYGGFAAALIKQPLWVMNVVPINGEDTLPTIFNRGLMGIYHDWCEAFNTYPRTYDLLHTSYLFGNLSTRCDIVNVIVEMDRILRPDGWVLVQDTIDMIGKIHPILRSLHWKTTVHNQQILVGRKSFWRPAS